jgi:hypothetical protein
MGLLYRKWINGSISVSLIVPGGKQHVFIFLCFALCSQGREGTIVNRTNELSTSLSTFRQENVHFCKCAVSLETIAVCGKDGNTIEVFDRKTRRSMSVLMADSSPTSARGERACHDGEMKENVPENHAGLQYLVFLNSVH